MHPSSNWDDAKHLIFYSGSFRFLHRRVRIPAHLTKSICWLHISRTTSNASQADVSSVPFNLDTKVHNSAAVRSVSKCRSPPSNSSHQKISESLERYLKDPVLPVPRSHYRRMIAGKTELQAMARMENILNQTNLWKYLFLRDRSVLVLWRYDVRRRHSRFLGDTDFTSIRYVNPCSKTFSKRHLADTCVIQHLQSRSCTSQDPVLSRSFQVFT